MKKKVMLLTGIGGGIGEAILAHFHLQVGTIFTASRTPQDKIFISSPTANWKHFELDLTVEKNVKQLFDQIVQEVGKIDILVNTIGGSLYSHRIEAFPIEEFEEIIAVNLRSAFLLTKFAFQAMKHNTPPEGHIVHFVSSSTKHFSANKAPYAIAKMGLARLIQYAAYEGAEFNIKVNGISPAFVFTPRHEDEIDHKVKSEGVSREEIVQRIVSHQLLKKPLIPQDLMPLVEFLITTDIITGQIYDATLGEVIVF
jgi:3-hydroxybutyrate dehydrogenase